MRNSVRDETGRGADAATDLSALRGSRGYLAVLADASRRLERTWGTAKVHRPVEVRRLATLAVENPDSAPLALLFEGGFLASRRSYAEAAAATLLEPGGGVDSLLSSAGLRTGDVADALARDLDAVVRLVPDPDWRRIVSATARVEMAYVPGIATGRDPSDVVLRHVTSPEGAAWSIVPDEAFALFLDMVNVSSADFLQALAAAGEPDPRACGETVDGVGLAAMWDRFDHRRDIAGPSLLSPRELVDVLRSTKRGSPLFVARVLMHDFLARDPRAPIAIAEGGMVGLHDFATGEGLVDPPAGRVTFADRASWRVVPDGASVATAHDIALDFFDVVLEGAPDHSPWKRVEEDRWRRRLGDHRQVEVTRETGDGRTEEFWVRTFDADGRPAGPGETPEFWLDFDEALAHGDELAAIPWDRSPPSP